MRAFIALGVALMLSAPLAARAEVIWRGNFESGDLSQWTKAQEVATDRLQVVDAPVRQGKHALRVEVRQGDDPINASGNRAELVGAEEKEGNDRYYAWSTMWAADYPSVATWQAFTQWHQTGDTGTPPLEMYVNGESMYLAIGPAETVVWTHPLERGKWHDFILHVKWSADPAVGSVELWYDGQQVLRQTSGATMLAGMDNIMKQGLYRNDTIAQTGVLYHDGMTVATTLADVLPPPPTPASTAGGEAGDALPAGAVDEPPVASPVASAGGGGITSSSVVATVMPS